jgi:hypothetical protein
MHCPGGGHRHSCCGRLLADAAAPAPAAAAAAKSTAGSTHRRPLVVSVSNTAAMMSSTLMTARRRRAYNSSENSISTGVSGAFSLISWRRSGTHTHNTPGRWHTRHTPRACKERQASPALGTPPQPTPSPPRGVALPYPVVGCVVVVPAHTRTHRQNPRPSHARKENAFTHSGRKNSYRCPAATGSSLTTMASAGPGPRWATARSRTRGQGWPARAAHGARCTQKTAPELSPAMRWRRCR